jgi:sugar phosphate isomerase/epimerase
MLAPKRLDATVAFYREVGCRYLIVPGDARANTKEGASSLAADLTVLSDKLAAYGMKVGYHNHAEEMHGADRQEPWDVIGNGTPHAAILQQDVGWTTFASKDPIAMVRRFPGRTVTVHYKAKIAPGERGIPIIGQDHADWAGLTQALRQVGGTEWIIVEQEEYPGDIGQLDAVAASLIGLRHILAHEVR